MDPLLQFLPVILGAGLVGAFLDFGGDDDTTSIDEAEGELDIDEDWQDEIDDMQMSDDIVTDSADVQDSEGQETTATDEDQPAADGGKALSEADQPDAAEDSNSVEQPVEVSESNTGPGQGGNADEPDAVDARPAGPEVDRVDAERSDLAEEMDNLEQRISAAQNEASYAQSQAIQAQADADDALSYIDEVVSEASADAWSDSEELLSGAGGSSSVYVSTSTSLSTSSDGSAVYQEQTIVQGGDGDDFLSAGNSDGAVLTGGAGADSFVIPLGEEPAVITDFNPAEDDLIIKMPDQAAPIGSLEVVAWPGNDGADVVVDGHVVAKLTGGQNLSPDQIFI